MASDDAVDVLSHDDHAHRILRKTVVGQAYLGRVCGPIFFAVILRAMEILHSFAVATHVGGGFASVVLGLIASLLPKRGPRARWHRRVGLVYVVNLLSSSVVGIPLSLGKRSVFLTGLALGTIFLLVTGWVAIRLARAAFRRDDSQTGGRLLRRHLILMLSSYVAAWSGFFANNFVLGTDAEWKFHFYAYGPSVIGAVVIGLSVWRWNRIWTPEVPQQ